VLLAAEINANFARDYSKRPDKMMLTIVILLSVNLVGIFGELSSQDTIDSCFEAVNEGDINTLKKILTQKDGSLNKEILNVQEKNTLQTLILKSILLGREDIAKMLLEGGADITITEKMGYSVIDAAAFQGLLRISSSNNNILIMKALRTKFETCSVVYPFSLIYI
jgi:hypothetical protein